MQRDRVRISDLQQHAPGARYSVGRLSEVEIRNCSAEALGTRPDGLSHVTDQTGDQLAIAETLPHHGSFDPNFFGDQQKVLVVLLIEGKVPAVDLVRQLHQVMEFD
jgi:hypothetical protein